MPTPVPQEVIDTVARKGTYVLNVNPRQLLVDNVGMDGFVGGGNLRVGQSAAELDELLADLATMPRATISLDAGQYYEHWLAVVVDDVRRLRAAFFSLYGLSKPDWCPPPLTPPQA